MGRILDFVRHKTAGWAGVVYLDKKDQKRVNNGCFDWPLTQEREEKLSVIEKSSDGVKDFLDRLDINCANLFTNMNYVHDLIRVDAIKRGGDSCDPR